MGCGAFKIKDGSQIRFWEDTWVDTKPLNDQFPNLYNIVHYPHDTLPNVIHQTPLNVSFRRALVGDKLIAWHNLVAKISGQQLSNGRDTFTWNLHRHNHFIVQSMYEFLINQCTLFRNKFIWKLKILLKIKIFIWYLQRGVILTKDNLAKRNWTRSTKCCFCDCNETIKHLFFDCQHAKIIWGIVHIAAGLTPPKSISHMLGHWLTGINKKDRLLIFVGAALIGAIWCTRNDLILERKTGYLIYAGYFQRSILAAILVPTAAWGIRGDYPFGKKSVRSHRFGYLIQKWMEKQ